VLIANGPVFVVVVVGLDGADAVGEVVSSSSSDESAATVRVVFSSCSGV
jgi:hypothetical protein